MGDVVLKPMTNPETNGWLRMYAHCTNNNADGDVTILAINVANNVTFNLTSLNNIEFSDFRREQYVFTSPSLNSRTLYLNGKLLQTSQDGSIPDLEPEIIPEGGPSIVLNSQSISFYVLKGSSVAGFGMEVCLS